MNDRERSQLWEAYRATTYLAEPSEGKPWRLRIGQPSPKAGPMAYITADNPGSTLLSEAENQIRRRQLIDHLEHNSHRFFAGRSVADQGDWPDEIGVWIPSIRRNEAVQIAKRFGQNAIVYVDEERRVYLVPVRK